MVSTYYLCNGACKYLEMVLVYHLSYGMCITLILRFLLIIYEMVSVNHFETGLCISFITWFKIQIYIRYKIYDFN